MSLMVVITILLLAAALFAYINERVFDMPDTIGVMLVAVLISLGLYLLDFFNIVHVKEWAAEFLEELNFSHTLLHGMIGFLLFSGSLNVRMPDLHEQRWLIGSLAVGSTVLGCFFVGSMIWFVLQSLGIDIDYIMCLVFGALISPTDPIACLGIFKKIGMPARLQILIEGESLFNDGVGVVVFLIITEIAAGEGDPSLGHVLGLFGQEALGGLAIGALSSLVAFLMLSGVKRTSSQALLTLALVAGCFTLAEYLHVSGLIAIVVSGLLIGNYGRRLAISEENRHHLDAFWELIDEVLNAVLFLLIGLHLLLVPMSSQYLIAALAAVPVVLLGRFLAVSIPVYLLRVGRRYDASRFHIIKLLTWGGLRGGISVAMVLALDPGPDRDLLLTMTFAVVVFSILVQGLTVGKIYTTEQLRWIAQRS